MIGEKIFTFFKEKGIADKLQTDTDLFSGGYINSLFALEMVLYLEKTFKIKIKDKEISEQNFRTVGNIVALLERLGVK